MTLAQFENLSLAEKIQTLHQEAVFLAQRKMEAGRIYLYAVKGFYVEILLDPPGSKNGGFSIYGVFGNAKCLDVYLGGLDITELQY